MFYGIRLSLYLFLREKTRKTPPPQAMMKQASIPKRITLALSVSLFYAFLATPALYALRNLETLSAAAVASSTKSINLLVTQVGLGLAVFGAVLEAVADWQKYLVKQASTDENAFEGPTQWAYRICRHPNYLGEVVYWAGIFIVGAPSFGTNVIPWVSSLLGFYGKHRISVM
jgi:steroid 5-alpha reductase family enzyme